MLCYVLHLVEKSLYTSESDVCRRQILTYKDGPRTERVKVGSRWSQDGIWCIAPADNICDISESLPACHPLMSTLIPQSSIILFIIWSIL